MNSLQLALHLDVIEELLRRKPLFATDILSRGSRLPNPFSTLVRAEREYPTYNWDLIRVREL